MPRTTQEAYLSGLQNAAKIKEYRNIDAGSVYELSKNLKSITASYAQLESLSLLTPALKGQKSNLQCLLEEDNVQNIVGDQTRVKILDLARHILKYARDIWSNQNIDTDAGVDLGMSEARLKDETKKILAALYQDKGAQEAEDLVKRIAAVLQGSVKLKPEQVLRKHLGGNGTDELVNKIALKFHLINDNMMKKIGEQDASFRKTRALLNVEEELMSELKNLKTALDNTHNTSLSSPSATPSKNDDLIKKVDTFLSEVDSGKTKGKNPNLTDLAASLPDTSHSQEVLTSILKVKQLVQSGYDSTRHQQLFKGCKIEETPFLKELKKDLDITDQDQVDLEKLCISLIEVDQESRKQKPNSEQVTRLLDMKAGLQARMSEAKIAKMRKDSEAILTDVTKAWEENMNKLDQANDGGSGLNADKEKLRLQDNTIDALQSILFTLSQGTELTASVHKKLVACQKQVKHMHLHQTASNDQRQKPTLLGRVRPLFSSHYAFSAITLYSLLAGLTLATSWYVAPVVQGILQPLAVAFGLCAVEKLVSQVHTAYTRSNIAFQRGVRPGFFESFWTMPASGRSNGLLSLVWVGVPHVLMGLAAISGAGIYARLAAFGRFFLSAERRLQVTAVGLSSVCAGKVMTNHAATPPTVSSVKDVEVGIICANDVQKTYVYRAWESVAKDFAANNKSVINDLVKEEYNEEMKKALTAFSNYNKNNKSVASTTLISSLQTIKSATIIESKPKRNILVTRANKLDADVTKVAVKLAKENYLSRLQADLTNKHYGFEQDAVSSSQPTHHPVKSV